MRIQARFLFPLLVLVLISLSTYSYLEMGNHLPYPTMKEIRTDYRAHLGERVSIFGRVVGTAGDAGVVTSDGLSFTVVPLTAKVGDLAEVLGILGEDYRITAEKSLVYEGLSYYSTFLTSLVGAALLAFFFLKNWKFDLRKFRFVRRD